MRMLLLGDMKTQTKN